MIEQSELDYFYEMLQQAEGYTEEPDAFETQSEREMAKELELEIDKEYLQYEKEKNKPAEIVKHILMNCCDKWNMSFNYNPKGKRLDIYFYDIDSFNVFMAQEKNSKRLNDNLVFPIDKKLTFDKLGKDSMGVHWMTVHVK